MEVLYLRQKKLFGGTIPPNNFFDGGTVPPNNSFAGGTVPPNDFFDGGTVPPNKFFGGGTVPPNSHFLRKKNFLKVPNPRSLGKIFVKVMTFGMK